MKNIRFFTAHSLFSLGFFPLKRRQRKDGEDGEELVRPVMEAPISEAKGGKAAKGPACAPLPRGQKSKAPPICCCLQVMEWEFAAAMYWEAKKMKEKYADQAIQHLPILMYQRRL